MANLKRCPCGEVPDSLSVEYDDTDRSWIDVVPSCCGRWRILFDARDSKFSGLQEIAESAWNEAPRGGDDI